MERTGIFDPGGSKELFLPPVQGDLCPGGSLSRGICLGRSLSREVSGRGGGRRGLCQGDPFISVNRMTDMCKNITVPQTSLTGGKNMKLHVTGGAHGEGVRL